MPVIKCQHQHYLTPNIHSETNTDTHHTKSFFDFIEAVDNNTKGVGGHLHQPCSSNKRNNLERLQLMCVWPTENGKTKTQGERQPQMTFSYMVRETQIVKIGSSPQW